MDFQVVRKVVSKITGIGEIYQGSGNSCVIAAMTVGHNVQVNSYYFPIFKQLEENFNVATYIVEGGHGDQSGSLEQYKKEGTISRETIALNGIEKGLWTIVEARFIAAEDSHLPNIIGGENEAIFSLTYDNFLHAIEGAAETLMMIGVLDERINEYASMVKNDTTIKLWKSSIVGSRKFVELELLPYFLEDSWGQLCYSVEDKEVFDWFEELQNRRLSVGLDKIDPQFIIHLRRQMNYCMTFYKCAPKRAKSLAESIASTLRQYPGKVLFTIATGFIWYLVTQELREKRIGFISLETSGLAKIDASIEKSNFDMFNRANGRFFGINPLPEVGNIMDAYMSKEEVYESINPCIFIQKLTEFGITNNSNEADIDNFFSQNKELSKAHAIKQEVEDEKKS